MNFRKLGIAVVAAGLLQAGDAMSATVTSIASSVYAGAVVRLGDGGEVEDDTARQNVSTNDLVATADAQYTYRDTSIKLSSSTEASWEGATKGQVRFNSDFEATNVDWAQMWNWRGDNTSYLYQFSVSERTNISIDMAGGAKNGVFGRSLVTEYILSGPSGFVGRISGFESQSYARTEFLTRGVYYLVINSRFFSVGGLGTRNGGYEAVVNWELTPSPVPVPLPALLLLTGLGGLGFVARRRKG